jgi:hypothetical protein
MERSGIQQWKDRALESASLYFNLILLVSNWITLGILFNFSNPWVGYR